MSFMLPAWCRPSSSRRARSYGCRRALVQIFNAAAFSLTVAGGTAVPPARAAEPLKIVALGDSLTAGYGLSAAEGVVPRLQAALAAKGIAAEIDNAGVSGDTAADGLARLDWSVPAGTDAVIVELGANDMLRGTKPEVTRAALDAILSRLAARHITVLLCGMRAAPNLGADYGQAFERIYPELAGKYGVALYPFFLDGVAGNLSLLQRDGLHPNASGVDAIVTRILPQIEALIAHIRAQHPS
jgi:acyl-CoA thioesterase-1